MSTTSLTISAAHAPQGADTLAARYTTVRQASVALAAPLAVEDQVLQSMPDASPTKWHLAHTTWFFETFVLAKRVPDYRPFHPRFAYLFNSYYNTVGEMHRRPQRGMLSRPTVAEVGDYRQYVDAQIGKLLAACGDDTELSMLITLGLNHEQQHQELLLTDIKHALAQNPLEPAYIDARNAPAATAQPLRFVPCATGIVQIGHAGEAFAFDNETPRHDALLHPHELASRPVNNAEFRAFVEDGGYSRAELWLSDGWACSKENNWTRPLYWDEDLATTFSLAGRQPLIDAAPVTHISLYEADAYARWAGVRLPTEAEWEHAAATSLAASGAAAGDGNFVESGALQPLPGAAAGEFVALFGDVWEWTMSAYAPYPGFTPLAGSLGEYNGKFMCNQTVLRGGSCATPTSHIRASYRNFFYPHQRWQFSGIRLARDV